jgi:hypothetical protein
MRSWCRPGRPRSASSHRTRPSRACPQGHGHTVAFFGHAFLARDEVYHRIGPERYPIEPLFGPNVAVEAARGATEQTIRDTVAEVLPERLAHEIGRVMKRRGGGGNDDGGEGVN